MQNKKINFINNITNDLSKKYIPSFTLLSLIQNCAITLRTNEHKEPAYFNLKLNSDDVMLYCTMYIQVENTVIKRKCADIINTFINRLETLYKNNYRLEFYETAHNKLSIMVSLLLSDNFSNYKIEEASVMPYVYAVE